MKSHLYLRMSIVLLCAVFIVGCVQPQARGFFYTGQSADVMVSGVGFNKSGGGLAFNLPAGMTTDGERLVLSDRGNNRILIWNTLPTDAVLPDVVLGQPNFDTNLSGEEANQLNWPVGVSTGGGKFVVADTNNNRILIWDAIPTTNQQPPDLILSKGFDWPWAVWTDGTKLVVTSTRDGKIFIWQQFPTNAQESPDITIADPEIYGTPRTIGSDGTHLIISDHNAFHTIQGTFFWSTFPTTNNQPYDFFVKNVGHMRPGTEPLSETLGSVFWGPVITESGKVLGVADRLYLWNQFPENATDAPDLAVGYAPNLAAGYDFGGKQSGDGSSIAVAGERVYVLLANANTIVGYNAFPTAPDAEPDFTLGERVPYTITNPQPASDGKSLVVASGFDHVLYMWRRIPEQSGIAPDAVYSMPSPPHSIMLKQGQLTVLTDETISFWDELPLNGESPQRVLSTTFGDVTLEHPTAIASDNTYFYIADDKANRVYVWKGVPEQSEEPMFSFSVARPLQLSSNGEYLSVLSQDFSPTQDQGIFFYHIAGFPDPVPETIPGQRFNLPAGALVTDNGVYIADTSFNRVQVWHTLESALAGNNPDAILGQVDDVHIKESNDAGGLFMPASLSFDGLHLWVGEFKFSSRVLRYTLP